MLTFIVRAANGVSVELTLNTIHTDFGSTPYADYDKVDGAIKYARRGAGELFCKLFKEQMANEKCHLYSEKELNEIFSPVPEPETDPQQIIERAIKPQSTKPQVQSG